MTRGLKAFVDTFGVLPLSGKIPDMKSDTESYINLQKIYRDKAKIDRDWILNHLEQNGEMVDETALEHFCKRASHLQLLSSRFLFPNQMDQSTAAAMRTALEIADEQSTGIYWYVVSRAAYGFESTHGRKPSKPILLLLLKVGTNTAEQLCKRTSTL